MIGGEKLAYSGTSRMCSEHPLLSNGDWNFQCSRGSLLLCCPLQQLDQKGDTMSFRYSFLGYLFEEFGSRGQPVNTDASVQLAAAYNSGVGEGGSEVVAEQDGILYVTNGEADKIDIIDAATGTLLNDVPLADLPDYDGLNSVAVSGNLIAVAVETVPGSTLAEGWIALYDLSGTFVDAVPVGNLPDMVTFSQDGSMIFNANEGEPNSAGDPMGSISIIDVATRTAQTFDFTEFDAQVDALREAGVRIFPGIAPSVDFEPEYIAEAGGKLFVSLQEAAAVAVFDLETRSWEEMLPLGVQDHSVVPLDASDDGLIDIATYDNLVGMRMPDAIAATEIGDTIYFLTANEGDDREDAFVFNDDVGLYEGNDRGDAVRVGAVLDGMASGNFVQYRDAEAGLTIDVTFDEALLTYLEGLSGDGLDRLTISTFDGDTDGDGDIDVLQAYGSRSFTIYDGQGSLVFDSGATFEQLLSVIAPERFNNDDGDLIGTLDDDGELIVDNRSDAKGPEPEAIEVGQIGDTTLAFIGLERDGGIMVYDITNPSEATFLDYIDGRAVGQESPEIIEFISAADSTTGEAQIAVSYEVSGTTAVFDLPFGETIKGGRRADDLTGSIGADTIYGRSGADRIDGGGGDDIIHGGLGRDIIEGGFGNDEMKGGFGRDTFVFDLFAGQDRILDLGRHDKIDLSATGLDFSDVTITKTGRKEFLVEYGEFGDSIDVSLSGFWFNTVAEDNFLI